MDFSPTRMIIEAHRKADYSDSPAASFQVMFNPNTYSLKYEAEYEAREGQGDTSSPQIFNRIKPREFAFEFLFDGTGTAAEKVDVKVVVEHFLAVAALPDGEIHRPMYLRLSWGALVVRCVLKSAEVTYTLFDRDGFPLRAKVKASFAENVEDELRVAEERKSSPDLTHVRVVEEGDHFSLMVHRIYGDPRYYLQVAAFNNLKNFRRLEVGQEIIFPPLKDVSN